MNFKLHSEYKPTGDQPQAIKQLVDGFKKGNQFQTLLGVTGECVIIVTRRNRPDKQRLRAA